MFDAVKNMVTSKFSCLTPLGCIKRTQDLGASHNKAKGFFFNFYFHGLLLNLYTDGYGLRGFLLQDRLGQKVCRCYVCVLNLCGVDGDQPEMRSIRLRDGEPVPLALSTMFAHAAHVVSRVRSPGLITDSQWCPAYH